MSGPLNHAVVIAAASRLFRGCAHLYPRQFRIEYGSEMAAVLHANFPFTPRFDPAVILPAALALALTAFVAGWVPARRASSIQASEALRAE